MRNLLLLCIYLTFVSGLQAQTFILNWTTSFPSSWTNGQSYGNALNIGGSGINASVSITKSGGIFSHAEANNTVSTPTVSGSSFVVAGSASNLEVGVDFQNHGEHAEVQYLFSAPVIDVQFNIADIDKPSANSLQYIDEVEITGSDGITTYLPAITKYDATTEPDFLVVSGNKASANSQSGTGGNAFSNSTDQRGTVTIDFGSHLINSITIRYRNANGAQHDPAAQSIAIGNISFQKPIALPVTFTYVKAKTQKHQNVVEWQTSSEYNNHYFEIEKSLNGHDWLKIGQVAGQTNSTTTNTYSFVDPETLPGMTHYRICQVGIDGKSRYSSIVSINNSQLHFFSRCLSKST